MSSLPLRGRSAQRGAALYFAMMVLMIFSVVGLALSSASMQAVRFTRIQENASTAFNAAESGADRAVLWLRQQDAPPSATAAFNPFGSTVALGGATYTVTVDGDDGNPGTEQKRYTIRSRGACGGRQETVTLFVQLSNFGRYAYFTDSETSSLTGSPIYFKSGEVVDGPAHSNNTGGSNFNINWLGSTTSIFKNGLTAAGTEISYTPTGPSNEADYQKIYGSGSRGYKLNAGRIELPATTDRQRNAAWGGTSGFPTSDGVYINKAGSVPLGGIYVRGNAQVEFKNSSGQQRVEITVPSIAKKYVLTLDRPGKTMTMTDGTTTTSYAGLVNGVIYCTGHITSLKGDLTDGHVSGTQLVSRNAWTVATDLANSKNVTITGDLEYVTTPDKSKPWDDVLNLKAACLGVVARTISMDETAPTNMTIHGVMLAGGKNTPDGSFYNEGWNTKSPGKLRLVGGIIQKQRGPVGTFNSSTGLQVTGWYKDYSYDPRMAVNPPPFFPTTGSYDRLSWSRTSAGSSY